MTHFRLFLICLLAVLLFADRAEAKPEYLEYYEAGLEAIDDEDWAEAAALMEQALGERDDEAKKLRRYRFFKPYVPNYFLGVAKFHLGDCRAALNSFKTSEGQNVLESQDELYEDMLELRQACESKDSGSQGSDTASSRERETARASPPPPPRPTSSSGTASRPTRPRSSSQSTGAGAGAQGSGRGAGVEDTPPPELDLAIDAFFSGDAERALTLLESVDGDHPKVRAHIRLLRSAAAYRLFLLSAETDHALLDKALRYLQEYRDVGFGVTPPRSLFGPRFLEFFSSNE